MKDDQRVALTKRLLQEGLLRLLKTKDISKINASELCAESGINRATFYRHYEQPRDIIGELRYTLSQEVNGLAEKTKALDDPKEWIDSMCRYFYERSDILSIMFQCRTDDEFVCLINDLFKKHLNIIRNQRIGLGLDDDELRLTTYCYAGGIYYILRQWIMEPIKKSPEDVAKVIYRFLMK